MNNLHPIFTEIINQHFPALAAQQDREREQFIHTQVKYMFGEYDPTEEPRLVREFITHDPDAVGVAMHQQKQLNRQGE